MGAYLSRRNGLAAFVVVFVDDDEEEEEEEENEGDDDDDDDDLEKDTKTMSRTKTNTSSRSKAIGPQCHKDCTNASGSYRLRKSSEKTVYEMWAALQFYRATIFIRQRSPASILHAHNFLSRETKRTTKG